MHIIICDDHPIVGAAMGMMLNSAFDAEVHLCPDFRRARAIAAALPHIDLWILDINIPGETLTHNLAGARAFGGAPVILFSGTHDPTDLDIARKTDVEGFLPKSAVPETIEAAVRMVLAGGRYTPDLTSEDEIAPVFQRGGITHCISAAHTIGTARLTARQQAVLVSLSRGASNKEIARSLGISPATVKAHLAQIFVLMGVANRTEAVMVAIQDSLIQPA